MIEHPSVEELVDYPLGRLTVERSREVWQHCSTCSTCGNELAGIILLRTGAITEAAAERPQWTWKYLAIAASIVLVVGIGWVSWRLLPGPSGDQLTAPTAPAVPVPSEYADLATRETLPQTHLDFRFGVATPAGTERGRVREGVQAIVDGRFDEAERSLRTLMLSDPSEETAVYLGVALYLQGDLSDETATLLGAADPAGGSLGRAGHWYLANLFVARGEVDAARPILEQLGAADDRWGRRSLELIEKIASFG